MAAAYEYTVISAIRGFMRIKAPGHQCSMSSWRHAKNMAIPKTALLFLYIKRTRKMTPGVIIGKKEISRLCGNSYSMMPKNEFF